MGTNEYSQPASNSSWDSQDFGDVNMVVKMAHFHKSSRPQWVKQARVEGALWNPAVYFYVAVWYHDSHNTPCMNVCVIGGCRVGVCHRPIWTYCWCGACWMTDNPAPQSGLLICEYHVALIGQPGAMENFNIQ